MEPHLVTAIAAKPKVESCALRWLMVEGQVSLIEDQRLSYMHQVALSADKSVLAQISQIQIAFSPE